MDRKGIIDRFEGNYVVIEVDGKTSDILKSAVSAEAKVGDVVVEKQGVWQVEKDETIERKKKIKNLIKDVWAD